MTPLSSRHRALFITPIRPATTGLGLSMRMGLIAEALARIAELHVIVVPVAGTISVGDDLLGRIGASVHTVDLTGGADTALKLLSGVDDPAARLDAFIRYGKPSLTGLVGPRLRSEIAAELARFAPNLLVIGRGYLSHLADLVPPSARLVLDLDEDDARSCHSQARALRSSDPVAADWLMQEGAATTRLIERVKAKVSRALVAAPADRIALQQRHRGLEVECFPNAVRSQPKLREQAFKHGIARGKQARGDTLLFVGALGYGPNVQAAQWLARQIMPRIRRIKPATRLVLAGARPSPAVRRLARHPGVTLMADLPKLGPAYARAAVVVAPLRSGGGTRIKLLEAVAYGKLAVATPAALAGLSSLPGVTLAPAQAGPFSRACLTAMRGKRQYRPPNSLRDFDARFAISRLAKAMAEFTGNVQSDTMRVPTGPASERPATKEDHD